MKTEINNRPVPTISAKKRTKLYGLIHEDIMQARIKIARLTNGLKIGEEIDSILYRLHVDCPENAVRLFERQSKQQIKE